MSGDHDRASEFVAGTSETLVTDLPSSPPGFPTAPGSRACDPLSEVLHNVKLTGALFFTMDATSPWCVGIPNTSELAGAILPRAQHIISYHVVVQGAGFASISGAEPFEFDTGDVIVVPHGDPYVMSSSQDITPAMDGDQTIQFFKDMAAGRLPFVVNEGGGGAPRAQIICGFLGCDARPFNPLLTALPCAVLVRRSTADQNDLLNRLIDLTYAEAQVRRVGDLCIRLRLSELMFVEVVRRYLENLPAGQSGWLAGLRDPAIGRALTLLHERPASTWTIEHLAREVGVSRSVLANRFTRLVGQPPMKYLTYWRIQLAAQRLGDGASKVSTVALDVGYASEAAFSRSFKKIVGISPAHWRERFSGSR